MSDQSGASIMGRWLVQEEGWAKSRAYKARKKTNYTARKKANNHTATTEHSDNQQQHNEHKQQESGSHEQLFQQLNIQGENLDKHDGKDFGDTMTKKGPNSV